MPFPASPNMGLLLPIPTVDPGPAYAEENNAAFSAIDAHDHSPGKGIPIRSASIAIDSDLSMGGTNLTNSRSIRLQDQSSALALGTDLRCIYSVGGNLYYNDGAGNQVRITLGGAIDTSTSGSISGMGSTTASVAYSSISSTFSFRSATSVPALLSVGTLKLSPIASASFNIAITAPTLAASYTLTLPSAPPASTKIMTMGSDGTVAAVYDTDNSSLEVSANALRVKAGGVTKVMQAAVGNAESAAEVTFTTGSSTFVTPTGLNATITTTGRPIILGLVSANSGNVTALHTSLGNGGIPTAFGEVNFFNSTTSASVSTQGFGSKMGVTDTGTNDYFHTIPAGAFTTGPIALAAGTYTFTCRIRKSATATTSVTVNAVKLYVYEL